MTWYFGGEGTNGMGKQVATRLFGYLDIEDSRSTHPALRGKGERYSYFRKAMTELRRGMIGVHSVIGVAQLDGDHDKPVDIPHMGHSVQCGDQCDGHPASRYFGFDILVFGKADVFALGGEYSLLDGKAILTVCGGSAMRLGALPLERVVDTH